MTHVHYSEEQLADILGGVKTVAIVGASTDDNRPSHWVTGFLLGKGYTVYPVNPVYAGQSILDQKIYARLRDVPDEIDMVDVFRRSEHLYEIVEEALALPELPRVIWGQLGVSDDRAAERAESAGIRVVMNRSLVSEYALVYGRTHGHAA